MSYLSGTLTKTEYGYTPIEKLYLYLYFSSTKLKWYIILVVVCVLYKINLIKYMDSKSIMRGKINKWTISLLEFSLHYVPQKAMKGQVLVDFLVDHPYISSDEDALNKMT